MKDINTCSQELKDYYQSPPWDDIRKRILYRDNFSCRLCGANNTTLHCHHIRGTHRFNEQNHPEDLMILCENCHTMIHSYFKVVDSIKEYYDRQRHEERMKKGYY